MLEAARPLNELQTKLEAQRQEIESFDIPDHMKQPLFAQIDTKLEAVDALRQSILDKSQSEEKPGNIADKDKFKEIKLFNKEIDDLASKAGKLTKETKNFIGKFSIQKQFQVAKTVAEAQQSIKTTKDNLNQMKGRLNDLKPDDSKRLQDAIDKSLNSLTFILPEKEMSLKEAASIKKNVDTQIAECNELLGKCTDELNLDKADKLKESSQTKVMNLWSVNSTVTNEFENKQSKGFKPSEEFMKTYQESQKEIQTLSTSLPRQRTLEAAENYDKQVDEASKRLEENWATLKTEMNQFSS